MLTRKIVVSLAAGVLVCGAGVASALADGAPSTPVVTAGDVQNGQQGVDEQGAANEIAAAANDVQSEVESEAADDQSGDQQGASDQSDQAGDNAQSAQENND